MRTIALLAALSTVSSFAYGSVCTDPGGGAAQLCNDDGYLVCDQQRPLVVDMPEATKTLSACGTTTIAPSDICTTADGVSAAGKIGCLDASGKTPQAMLPDHTLHGEDGIVFRSTGTITATGTDTITGTGTATGTASGTGTSTLSTSGNVPTTTGTNTVTAQAYATTTNTVTETMTWTSTADSTATRTVTATATGTTPGTYTAQGTGTATITVTGNTTGTASFIAATTAYQINAGGGAVSPYASDTYFSGSTSTASTTATISTAGATNPAPASVYKTQRYGNMTYTLPSLVVGDLYKIRLHFAESFVSAPNQRLFNVDINSVSVMWHQDIYASAGGKNIAWIYDTYARANASGQIIIVFTNVTDNAMVMAIEAIRQGPYGPAQTLTYTGTGTRSTTVTETIATTGTATSAQKTGTWTLLATGTGTHLVTTVLTATATSATQTAAATGSISATATGSTTATSFTTDTVTRTLTYSATGTATGTVTQTATASATATDTYTVTGTVTGSGIVVGTGPNSTGTITLTTTDTATATKTATSQVTGTTTGTLTRSWTATGTGTQAQALATVTYSNTITMTVTATGTGTASAAVAAQATSPANITITGSLTATATTTTTGTGTGTASATVTGVASATGTTTYTHTANSTETTTSATVASEPTVAVDKYVDIGKARVQAQEGNTLHGEIDATLIMRNLYYDPTWNYGEGAYVYRFNGAGSVLSLSTDRIYYQLAPVGVAGNFDSNIGTVIYDISASTARFAGALHAPNFEVRGHGIVDLEKPLAPCGAGQALTVTSGTTTTCIDIGGASNLARPTNVCLTGEVLTSYSVGATTCVANGAGAGIACAGGTCTAYYGAMFNNASGVRNAPLIYSGLDSYFQGIVFGQSFLPSNDATYSLGSLANRFKRAYLSETLYFPTGSCTDGVCTGNLPLSAIPASAHGWLHDNGAGTRAWSTPTASDVGAMPLNTPHVSARYESVLASNISTLAWANAVNGLSITMPGQSYLTCWASISGNFAIGALGGKMKIVVNDGVESTIGKASSSPGASTVLSGVNLSTVSKAYYAAFDTTVAVTLQFTSWDSNPFYIYAASNDDHSAILHCEVFRAYQ